jgi:hypothetical protein
MKNDAAGKPATELLRKAQEAAESTVNQLFRSAHQALDEAAMTYGHEINDTNRDFYGCMAALQIRCRIDEPADTALRVVHDTAMQFKFSNPGEWAAAAVQRDNLTQSEENTGEMLGFGVLSNYDPLERDQLTIILDKCGSFYAVPEPHRAKVGWLTEQLVTRMGKDWSKLPIGWTGTYALVVYAIVAACGYGEKGD